MLLILHGDVNVSEEIRIKKSVLWKGLIGILALFVLILFFNGESNDWGSAAIYPNVQNAPSPTGGVIINAEDLVDDDPYMGDTNSPLTIVEFSDYQCPFCAKFKDLTLNKIKSEYIDTGKVKFVYRDFPLSFHPFAQKAAEAAECAGDQNRYWDYHDKIFENQASLSLDKLKQIGVDLELDIETFNECLDSGKYQQEVLKDFQEGQSLGVSGTPYFIVGNVPISGAQPFEKFKTIIDSQL